MSGKIFINYRRSVNLKDAQLLQNALHRHFGKSGVFLDVSGLDGGAHWLHTLERQIDDSVAMVSLLGKGWVDIRDEQGDRRLDNPNDFVRFEIARAFARNLPVLPVLIDGAVMPQVSELPSNVVPLAFPQAMVLRSESINDDADKIARRLKHLVAAARPRGVPAWKVGALVAVALAIGVAAGPHVLTAVGMPSPWPGSEVQRLNGLLAAEKEKGEVAARRLQQQIKELTGQGKSLSDELSALKASMATLKSENERLTNLVPHEKKEGGITIRLAN